MATVDDLSNQQKTRLYRVATLAAGMFVHLIVCAVVQSIGYMEITPAQLLALGSLAMAGFLALAVAIGVELNLSLEDPDMSFSQITWALTIVVITAVYATDLKAVVLFTGAVMVVMSANRLDRRQQLVLSGYGIALYVASTVMVSNVTGLGWVTEIVLMLAFGVVLVFGPALYRFETTVMENVISDKNEELGQALEQIREMAVRDELTGVFNRRHLMEVLAQEKARSERKNYTFSVCFVDLDFFKKVNDQFGHAAGDDVLRNFASIAHDVVREVDCVARIGGEEFVLVLAGTTETDAIRCAERLAEGLKSMPVSHSEPQYRITASVGITEYRVGEDVQQTIERADKALYEAKRTGRNKVVLAGAETNPLSDARVVAGQV